MVEQNTKAESNELNGSEENMFYTDPDGVKMHRRSLYEHQYTDEQLRSMK